jgi:pyruvate dehydrogenase E2 component (dihydrolipoamide acetyltransferase)
MPQLGETVSEGTITRWLRAQGDTVAADEPLVEIATDKVSMEVPTLRAGVLLEVIVKEGETVPVGAALAWLEVEGVDAVATEEVAAEPGAAQPVAAAEAAEPTAAAAAPGAADDTAAADSVDATPAARADQGERRPSPLIRRLLDEAGLTAADVKPSGPGGRITREDVSAAVAARLAAPSTPEAAPAPPKRDASGDHTQPLSRVRAVIAERMVTSLHTSAQLTSVVEVDVTRIAQLRARAGSAAARGVKLSYLPFFARAAVEALEAQPDLNASVDTAAGTVTRHSAIHLAIAVDTDHGLLAPVIRDAGRLSLVGIAMAIADVAARTRDGTITADDLSGGTFTITNTGSRGALFDTPIINQPQVAILGTGAVVRRPVVVTDPGNGAEAIAIRSMAFLALTYDHRLIDGAAAAKFLVAVRKRLEEGRFSPDLGLSES